MFKLITTAAASTAAAAALTGAALLAGPAGNVAATATVQSAHLLAATALPDGTAFDVQITDGSLTLHAQLYADGSDRIDVTTPQGTATYADDAQSSYWTMFGNGPQATSPSDPDRLVFHANELTAHGPASGTVTVILPGDSGTGAGGTGSAKQKGVVNWAEPGHTDMGQDFVTVTSAPGMAG